MSVFNKKNIFFTSIFVALLFFGSVSSYAQTDTDPTKDAFPNGQTETEPPVLVNTPPDVTAPVPEGFIPTSQLPNTEQNGDSRTKYTLLEPFGDFKIFESNEPCPFVKYLNIVIRIFLGICAVLAMIMIIMGGLQYMTSELPSFKEDGKSKVTNAVLGFVIALAAYALLNTLNPKLLNLCPQIPKAIIDISKSNSIFDKEMTAENIARCSEITDPDNPCNPQNLTQYFGDKADEMSKICHIESGGEADAESGTDKGTDGNPFSFGLLQINLLINGQHVGPECKGLFMISSTGESIPPAGDNQYINGKKYDAMLKPGKESQYNACKAKLMDPETNLKVAKKLFDIMGGTNSEWGSMQPWHGDYCVCASAFATGTKKCN